MTKQISIQLFVLITLVLLLGSSSLLLPTGLQAQEPTSTPTVDLTPSPRPDTFGQITSVQYFPVFPSGILFWIRAEVRFDETERVDVFLRQNDEAVGTGSVPEPLGENLVFGYEAAAMFRFFLDFDEYPELDLFEPLLFRTEVVTLEGISHFFEIVVPVEHQDVGTWETSRLGQQLTLHWNDPNFGGREVLRDLDDVIRLLETHLDEVEPMEIALYAPFEPFCDRITDADGNEQQVIITDRENFPCSEDLAQEVYEERDVIYMTLPNIIFLDVLEALTEVIVTTQYDRVWGDAEVPAWFRVGLARYFIPNVSAEPLQRVQRAAQRGSLLRYDMLLTEPDAVDQDELLLWESHAELLVTYMAAEQGAEAPMALARLIADGQSFDDAFATVMDTDIRTFFATWRIWIDSAEAQQAARWNVYVPTTPTPTPTVTPSEVPPTREPVPTSTLTPSWTPRPLFVPTNPPTSTRAFPTSRPTLTLTPLPAGFFDNQPVAQTESDGEGSDGALCSAGIGSLFLPLIAGIVVWRRKRG